MTPLGSSGSLYLICGVAEIPVGNLYVWLYGFQNFLRNRPVLAAHIGDVRVFTYSNN